MTYNYYFMSLNTRARNRPPQDSHKILWTYNKIEYAWLYLYRELNYRSILSPFVESKIIAQINVL
jgi:hypothetical protein